MWLYICTYVCIYFGHQFVCYISNLFAFKGRIIFVNWRATDRTTTQTTSVSVKEHLFCAIVYSNEHISNVVHREESIPLSRWSV